MKTTKFILLIAIVSFFASCKKEETTSSDIVFKKLNTQVDIGSAFEFDSTISINFDNNSTQDFYLQFSYFSIGRLSEYNLYISTDDSRNQWLIYHDGEENIAKNLIVEDVIDSTSTTWEDNIMFYRKHTNNGVIQVNFTENVGVGDVFVGVRFIADDGEYRYGWIKLAISSDFKTIKIKEYAYHKQPNVAIKAGEK